jgi:hypothetical protein
VVIDIFTGGACAYSTNGISWTAGGARTNGLTSDFSITDYQFIYAAGSLNGWYTIRENGTNQFSICSSTNHGVSWTGTTATATGVSGGSGILSAWGNGIFVAVQQGTTISWTSTDAATWTANASAFTANSNGTYFRSLIFANGFFVATTNAFSTYTYAIWFSSDGVNWTQSSSVGTNRIGPVAGLTV